VLPDFSHLRIAVIGDAIWDRYVYGRVDRISPEAPVPVFVEERVEMKRGGAANVAANVRALGADAWLSGHLPGNWPVKTRFVVGTHQSFRVDRENTESIEAEQAKMIMDEVTAFEPDMVIVSDYAKGVVTWNLMDGLRASGLRFIVDPKRDDWLIYRGADAITPNRAEAGMIENSGLEFAKAVVVTLGEEGADILRYGQPYGLVRARRVEVADVTGAGDTFIATLGCALAVGLDLVEAVRMSNAAAAVVVGKRGTATCTLKELEAIYA